MAVIRNNRDAGTMDEAVCYPLELIINQVVIVEYPGFIEIIRSAGRFAGLRSSRYLPAMPAEIDDQEVGSPDFLVQALEAVEEVFPRSLVTQQRFALLEGTIAVEQRLHFSGAVFGKLQDAQLLGGRL